MSEPTSAPPPRRRIHPLDEVVPEEALDELTGKLERLAERDPMARKLLDKLAAGTEPPTT